MVVDERFKRILKRHKLDKCKCGREIDRGDVAWNEGATEYGTPYGVLEIVCLACGEEIFWGTTWGSMDSFKEFVDELEEAIEREMD